MAYVRQKPIGLLTRDDLDALLAACGRSTTGVRLQALLAVLYYAGLRTQESLDLRPADIKLHDDGTAAINVRRGKGGTQRVVTLAAPGLRYLTAWLDLRSASVTTAKAAPVFCTHSAGSVMQPGRPLDSGSVRAALARLARRVNLGKRVHLHALRHGHATFLHHRGIPIASIQVQLGHTSPLTTVRYLAGIGAHDAHAHIAAAFAVAA